MWLLHQIGWVVRAPLALFALSRAGWALVLLYLLFASGLLGAVAWAVVTHQQTVRQLLLHYLFPESWHFAAELLVEHLLSSQTRAVLINATASGSLVLVAVLLFPLKERLSATFERERRLADQAPSELPLWQQGVEELSLLLLYLATFAAIFWIGYPPDPGRRLLATVLSYGFLFFSFAVDFVSPLLQRHGGRYSQILKTLLQHPLAALGFGATFALPAVLVGLWLQQREEIPLATAVIALFSANLIAIVWATVAGTWLAARLLPTAQQTPRTSAPLRWLCWLALLAALAVNGYLFGSLGAAVHHKSQLLKCAYSVAPGSIEIDLPRAARAESWRGKLKAAWGALTEKTVAVEARMVLTVKNPTPFDVTVERNRIEVRHGETRIAEGWVSPLAVPAGGQRTQLVQLDLRLRPGVLRKGHELFANRWRITLFLRIAPGFDFPVYLASASG
jgi:hypothetical protein